MDLKKRKEELLKEINDLNIKLIGAQANYNLIQELEKEQSEAAKLHS